MSTPRIYAACLSSYVAGKLHGAWVDCDQDTDDIRAEIALMLKGSTEPGAEEYAIHDHEGWGGIHISEHSDIEKLSALACLADVHGFHVLGLASLHGLEYHTPESLKEAVEFRYQGHYESAEAYAYDYVSSIGEVPDWVEPYVDYERFGQDMLTHDFDTVDDPDGGFHVYSKR
jgi:antirestriction protein